MDQKNLKKQVTVVKIKQLKLFENVNTAEIIYRKNLVQFVKQNVIVRNVNVKCQRLVITNENVVTMLK